MKNKILFLLNCCFIFIMVLSLINIVFADTASDVKSAMGGLKTPTSSFSGSDKINPIINTAIGFIQIAGTGIAMIMVTILGIKYMLASPGEKADVKKQITPMAIGAFILFASANLVQIIYDFAATLPKA